MGYYMLQTCVMLGDDSENDFAECFNITSPIGLPDSDEGGTSARGCLWHLSPTEEVDRSAGNDV